MHEDKIKELARIGAAAAMEAQGIIDTTAVTKWAMTRDSIPVSRAFVRAVLEALNAPEPDPWAEAKAMWMKVGPKIQYRWNCCNRTGWSEWATWGAAHEPLWHDRDLQFRLPPDKFAAEKAAHAAGKVIEYRKLPGCPWERARTPCWDPEREYRVKPLEFGDPPAGWTWHNPGNLTPEQVGVDEGYRLCLTDENRSVRGDMDFMDTGGWTTLRRGEETPIIRICTYRTKAPLPAAKTPEEIEHAAFQAWYDAAPLEQRVHAAKHGWKSTVAAYP